MRLAVARRPPPSAWMKATWTLNRLSPGWSSMHSVVSSATHDPGISQRAMLGKVTASAPSTTSYWLDSRQGKALPFAEPQVPSS